MRGSENTRSTRHKTCKTQKGNDLETISETILVLGRPHLSNTGEGFSFCCLACNSGSEWYGRGCRKQNISTTESQFYDLSNWGGFSPFNGQGPLASVLLQRPMMFQPIVVCIAFSPRHSSLL